LARGGLYAGMWNRQREAEAAREKLALVGDEPSAPSRNPPVLEEEPEPPIERDDAVKAERAIERADAAE
jgi:ATP-binding cassette subfamily B protein